MLIMRILVIGFLVSAGQTPTSEPGVTAERIAECDAATKRLTDQILSNPGRWDPGGPIEREINRCQNALRAHAVILALAKRRAPYHVEATHVRSGTVAARNVVDTFNRDGLRAEFDSLDLQVLDPFRTAVAAEACLTGSNAQAASVAAAQQALETFNRLGANSVYPSSTREAIEECLERKK